MTLTKSAPPLRSPTHKLKPCSGKHAVDAVGVGALASLSSWLLRLCLAFWSSGESDSTSE